MLALAMFAVATPGAAEPLQAALIVSAPDLLEPQRRDLEDRIRGVVRENGVMLLDATETVKRVSDARKIGVDCKSQSLACQAQLGVLIGVKHVVIARVTSDWAGDRIDLRLLDALRGVTVRETSQALSKNDTLQSIVLRGAVLRVMAPDKTGTILVRAQDDTVVAVDGVVEAQALTSSLAVAPGQHTVEMRAQGRAAEVQTVNVVEGQSVTVELRADVAPASVAVAVPPAVVAREPMWPWLVGGGALLATTAGLGAAGLDAMLEYSPQHRDTRDAMQATGVGLLGAVGVGVIVAGAGAGLLLVGDEP